MKHSVLCLLLASGCGATPAPMPIDANDTTDGEAESCLRTKVWEFNRDGWSIRNSGTVRLSGGAHKSYAVNLYTSREYYLLACGAGVAHSLTLQLYNAEGAKLGSVADQGRQPAFQYTPEKAGPHFVVVGNQSDAPVTGSISWTVLYR